MPEHVLAIDQGTTGTTVMIIGGDGRICGRSYGEVRQYYPRPGWVEHDAEEIYRSTIELSRKALKAARLKASDIASIGITNQRETFVLWERGTGRPVHRAIVWQCRRSADVCDGLRDREDEVASRTGLLIDPYFSGTKLKWLLDRNKTLRRRGERGELCFGTIETWLLFRLSAGDAFVTDYTNASRTMLLNLETRKWDPVMLEMLGVPAKMLPAVKPSLGPLTETASGVFGRTRVSVGAAIGDQQSALFGQGCVEVGQAKVTYGTGAFLLMHTGTARIRSRHRLLSTLALGPDAQPAFALEGAVFIAGAAVQWLRDELGLVSKSSETENLARASRDRSQPYVVPAFVGLGAPWWDSGARGAIVGITRGTTRADIVRATLDSIAYQVSDVLAAMERDTGRKIPELRVDGGATANGYLMQFQADLIGRRVIRPEMAETTAAGAAILAGMSAGLWRGREMTSRLRSPARSFKPSIKRRERDTLVALWHEAVARTLSR